MRAPGDRVIKPRNFISFHSYFQLSVNAAFCFAGLSFMDFVAEHPVLKILPGSLKMLFLTGEGFIRGELSTPRIS